MAEMASEQVLRAEVVKLVDLCGARKEQVYSLMGAMDKLGLFQAPASATHHSNCPGGLMMHSVGVTKMLLVLRNAIDTEMILHSQLLNDVTVESCVIAGLFHDLHKLTDGFGRPHYLPYLTKTGKTSEGKPYEGNRDEMALADAYKSVFLVMKYVDLYEHEIQAIACHDGAYVVDNRTVALKEHPLTLLLHWADMWSGILIENPDSWLYRRVSEKLFCK